MCEVHSTSKFIITITIDWHVLVWHDVRWHDTFEWPIIPTKKELDKNRSGLDSNRMLMREMRPGGLDPDWNTSLIRPWWNRSGFCTSIHAKQKNVTRSAKNDTRISFNHKSKSNHVAYHVSSYILQRVMYVSSHINISSCPCILGLHKPVWTRWNFVCCYRVCT